MQYDTDQCVGIEETLTSYTSNGEASMYMG